MKRKITLKSLLMMATMLVSGGAWAAEEVASLDPVGVITYTKGDPSSVSFDATATTWNFSQGGVSGGKIGRYNGPYTVVKFDATTALAETNLLKATLDFEVVAGEYNNNIAIALMSDASFDPATVTVDGFNTAASEFQAGDWSVKKDTKAFSYIVTDYVSASKVIAFAIYGKNAREQTLQNVKLTLTTTNEVVYNITFTETNGVAAKVVVDNVDVTSGTQLVDGNYTFTATASGYEDYSGSFTVAGADQNVTFAMTAKVPFTYTVNAVDFDNNLIKSGIATCEGYVGEKTKVTWSKYIQVEDQWYVTDTTKFVTEVEAEGTLNVNYRKSDIAYFVECEKMHGVRSDRDATEDGGSNNVYIRISKYSKTYYTDPIVKGGLYDLAIPYYNSNEGEETYAVLVGPDKDHFTDTGKVLKCVSKGSGSMTLEGIEIPEGNVLAISYAGSGNALARMDYLTLTACKASVTVTAAGWATFASDYALNLTEEDGAYKVTEIDGENLVVEAVTGAVAAGTPLLVKGAGEHSFEVVTAGEEVADNKLVRGTGAAAPVDSYVLTAREDVAVFAIVDAESNAVVGTNQAYLVLESSARELKLGGQTTGIKAVETVGTANGELYNLAGQRVVKAQKGLYIMNGKKVVVK